MLRLPSAQMVHAISQKALDGLFSNLVHTVIVIVPRLIDFTWSCVKGQGHTITKIDSFCHF